MNILELTNILEKIEYVDVKKIIFSKKLKKDNMFDKIKSEPKLIKNKIFFQFEYFYDQKVKHENIHIDKVKDELIKIIELSYKQINIITFNQEFIIYTKDNVSFKFITKNIKNNIESTANKDVTTIPFHDNIKNYIIKEGQPIEWLVKLGIMNKDGYVLKSKKKKFRQINSFLEIIDNIYGNLPNDCLIIDFGCGKSYLTFALYYFFEMKNKNVEIIGLDLKKDIIDYCNILAEEFGFNRLKFINTDIKDFDLFSHTKKNKVDMIISLHACNIATDYVIFNAIKWDSKVILAVPCCQNEINSQIKSKNLILKHGILKEKFSSILTDAIRANLMEAFGYKTDVIEFIEVEETPKNTMIKGILKNSNELNLVKLKEVESILKEYNVSQTLYNLLKNYNY